MESDSLTIAYLLIAVGFVLMFAEMFLPTGGILFVFASAAFIGGVTMMFASGATRTAIFTVCALFAAVPLSAWAIFSYYPKISGQYLRPPFEDDEVAAVPGAAGLQALLGRLGTAVSTLRPAGVAEFDGRRVDCISEGIMIEEGSAVKVIEVKPGKVIVRRVEQTRITSLEDADFG